MKASGGLIISCNEPIKIEETSILRNIKVDRQISLSRSLSLSLKIYNMCICIRVCVCIYIYIYEYVCKYQ